MEQGHVSSDFFLLIKEHINFFILFTFWKLVSFMQVFLFPSDIHEIVSKARLQKNWSNTYKRLPSVGKREAERKHFILSRVGTHT